MTTNKNFSSTKSYSEIYGLTYLRGMAVAFVLLYHLKVFDNIPTFLSGGFLGVDIFFVVSGYILSSFLLNIEITFSSILRFYERRIRRIAPMLLIIVILTVYVASKIFTNLNFETTIATANYSLLSILNYYFIENNISYGQGASNFYPLLHLWSLSIEAQFYLFLPITLFLVKYFQRFSIFLITSLILASLSYQIYLEFIDLRASYFSTLARFWQPMIGVLLALVLKLNLGLKFRKIFEHVFVIYISFGVVILCIFLANESEVGRSFYSLLISLATLVFINKIVSSDNKNYYPLIPLRYLGLISYSTYLWHYPVFTIINFIYLDVWVGLKPISAFILTILLSIATYYFVEKLFQNKKLFSTVSFLIIIFISVFGFKSLITKYELDIPSRIDTVPQSEGWNLNNNDLYLEWAIYRKTIFPPLFIENTNEKYKILIVGDSHGADTFHMFNENKELFPNYSFSVLRGVGPQGDVNYEIDCLASLISKGDEYCRNVKYWYAKDLFNNADIVMFSDQWNAEDFLEVEKSVSMTIESGKKVVLLGNTVQVDTNNMKKDNTSNLKFNLLDYFIATKGYFPSKVELDIIEKAQYLNAKGSANTDKAIMEMAKRNGAYYLDKKYLFCDKIRQTCLTVMKEENRYIKMSFDSAHLTIEGAKYIGRRAKNIKFLSSIHDDKPTYDLFFQ